MRSCCSSLFQIKCERVRMYWCVLCCVYVTLWLLIQFHSFIHSFCINLFHRHFPHKVNVLLPKHDCHIIISEQRRIEQNRTEQIHEQQRESKTKWLTHYKEKIATNDKEKEFKHENEWLIGINTQETRNACMEWRKKSSNI